MKKECRKQKGATFLICTKLFKKNLLFSYCRGNVLCMKGWMVRNISRGARYAHYSLLIILTFALCFSFLYFLSKVDSLQDQGLTL